MADTAIPALEPLAVRGDEAARLAGVSPRRWRGLDASARIPRGIRLGRAKVWSVDELRRWLAASGISSGAVFRGVSRHGNLSRRGLHKDCVGWILKLAARRAGLKPEPVGGHSLRAGCVTQAAMNGVSERDIMRQTGHKSAEMPARYIRIGEIFTRNAAAGLGT